MPQLALRVGPVFTLAASVFAACVDERTSAKAVTYDDRVGAILAAKCTNCHGDAAAAGGWRATSYLAAIGCVSSGAPAVLPAGPTAPLVRVLDDDIHRDRLSDTERSAVLAWVEAGAPKFAPAVHDPSFVDPRSPRSHARALRAESWRSMLDASSEGACGRCHDGTPSGRPNGVVASAPGATACTSCHAEPGGVLACSTCHGDGARAAPPRDRCFFPEDVVRAGAHVAHVEPSALHADGLACKSCHPVPDATNLFAGAHANGAVEVSLDPTLAGRGAQFHADTGACSTACHARPGAAKPAPAWSDEGPLGCGDCHGDPPPGHLAGACTSCHRESDAAGTHLSSARLHVNGRVDLGDGSGACGACHGRGADAWPDSGAHATHRAPPSAAAVACEACHDVPTTFGAGAGHPHGGPAVVRFSGLAVARGAPASFASGTCSQVYCHGAGLIGPVAPTRAWLDTSGAAKQCNGGCHGTPPGPPHIADTSCWKCHPSDVDPGPSGPTISVPARHVNGAVDK